MIKCKKGHTVINGTVVNVLTEMSVLSLSVYQLLKMKAGEDEAKRILLNAVNVGISADKFPEGKGEPDNG